MNCVTVENMVESMLRDYCRTIEENHQLNEELKHCDEVNREHFNLISQLEIELREKNVGKSTNDTNDPNVDCQNEIEELQAQLEERGKMIEELLAKMNVLQPKEPESIIKDGSVDSNPTVLAEETQKLRDTIKDLEAISGDIETTFNKKDNQLQGQQAIIDGLIKQLESQSDVNLESESICMSELKEMRERNQILANQTLMLEEQLGVLMDEHNRLMENNNDLIKSIIVCQTEICKYDFE